MIRLMGIFSGSALAVAAIVIAVGLPELTPAADVSDLKFASQPEAMPNADVNIVAASEAALPAATGADDANAAVNGAVPATVTASSPALVEPDAEPARPAPATIPSQNWYAFWSPFRSEIAAEGFIAELQRTTGLDYRVVKLKPGVYEVAFAYSDPPDRDTKLARIVAATGLDMSGG